MAVPPNARKSICPARHWPSFCRAIGQQIPALMQKQRHDCRPRERLMQLVHLPSKYSRQTASASQQVEALSPNGQGSDPAATRRLRSLTHAAASTWRAWDQVVVLGGPALLARRSLFLVPQTPALARKSNNGMIAAARMAKPSTPRKTTAYATGRLARDRPRSLILHQAGSTLHAAVSPRLYNTWGDREPSLHLPVLQCRCQVSESRTIHDQAQHPCVGWAKRRIQGIDAASASVPARIARPAAGRKPRTDRPGLAARGDRLNCAAAPGLEFTPPAGVDSQSWRGWRTGLQSNNPPTPATV